MTDSEKAILAYKAAVWPKREAARLALTKEQLPILQAKIRESESLRSLRDENGREGMGGGAAT